MKIQSHRDLEVYKIAFRISMDIFVLTKHFPTEEKYSLSDQIRRSSRSVCSNLAEAMRKRRYPKAFSAKLLDCESESAETQVWLDYALECGYLKQDRHEVMYRTYDHILGKLVRMGQSPEKWAGRSR